MVSGVNRAADPGGCVEVRLLCGPFSLLSQESEGVLLIGWCFCFLFCNFSVYKDKRTK